MTLKAEKIKMTTKIFVKNLGFFKKIVKICHIKKFKNYSMAIKNLSVTYHQTPYDFFSGPLRLERPE